MKRFWSDESGATAIEYAVIGMIITVTIIASFMAIGAELDAMLDSAAAGFQ